MSTTADLINSLSQESKALKPLPKPSCLVFIFVIFATIYFIAAQIFIGVRSDILIKLSQPFFVAEILLMTVLFLSCVVSAVLMIYPDGYQRTQFFKSPYLALALLAVFFSAEFLLQNADELVAISNHKISCSLCIAAITVLPSFGFFYILRKSANINPMRAGIIAVIAASTIGCINLRFAEQNDLLSHLFIWHYFPIIIFALIGAALGKFILKKF